MRTTLALLGLFPATLAIGACSTVAAPPPAPIAQATIRKVDGAQLGSATITGANGTVMLSIDLAALSPDRLHGVHLHSVGKCEGPAFASAGGHLNPFGKQHGADNPAGSHLGDLPNLQVDRRGTARLSVALSGTQVDLRSKLFDADGTAIVVHADPDDLRTDPSGNSGTRIACGVLVPLTD